MDATLHARFANMTDYFENLGIPRKYFPLFVGGVILATLNLFTLISLAIGRKSRLAQHFFSAVSKNLEPLFRSLREDEEKEYTQSEIFLACVAVLFLFTLLIICLLCFCCCQDRDKPQKPDTHRRAEQELTVKEVKE